MEQELIPTECALYPERVVKFDYAETLDNQRVDALELIRRQERCRKRETDTAPEPAWREYTEHGA